MKFYLRPEGADGPDFAATADFENRFAAENWAMDWVRQHAKQDSYLLESPEIDITMTIFKTNAGQWYRMQYASA